MNPMPPSSPDEPDFANSPEWHNRILDSLTVHVCVIDPSGRIVYANEAWKRFARANGCPENETYVGFNYLDICDRAAGDCSEEAAVAARGVREILQGTRDEFYLEYPCHSPGEKRWFALRASPFPFRGQRHVVIAHEIITERKRAEEEAFKAQSAAEAANRAKSAFLANMSHEIRTPLNAVLGFSQILQRDPSIKPEQKETLDLVCESGELLLQLISDILDMSKIEAGHMALDENPLQVMKMIRDIESIFSARAREKNLFLQVRLDPALPAFLICDDRKLRQILVNLIGNAIKFTEKGGVTVEVSTQASGGGSGSLTIRVQDTGIGIAKEQVDRIFDPFYQVDSHMPNVPGTGLGLAIVHSFVRLMNGTLTVRSEIGWGSVFEICIPVSLPESVPSPDEFVSRQREVVCLEDGQPPFRILIVEDNEVNQLLLEKILTSVGFETRTASNGREGVSVWEQWRPDLICMDIRMPTMDGLEATRRIRSHPSGRTAKIIALTAGAFEEDRSQILEAGCDDYLRKPFRQDELFERLHRHLGVRFVYRDVAPAPDPSDDVRSEAAETSVAGTVLPRDLLEELRHAAIVLDLDRVLELADRVKPIDESLAKTLQSLAKGYQFEKMAQLLGV